MSPVVTEEELVDRLDLSNKNESLIRLQAQKEQNLQTASEQILQVIQTALQQTIQSQQQQQIVQTAAESGQYTDEDLQKMQDQQQQPISHEDLVEVVTDIIKQTQGTVAQNATTQTGGETNE
jgi:dTDP-4-dehydrorhamnose reductase